MTLMAGIGRRMIALAIAVLLLTLPAWGGKKPPEFGTIEITRFSKQQGVELSQDFVDYLYDANFRSRALGKVFARFIVENEVVSREEAPHTLTLRGAIVDYGKGNFAKSLIGFGVGRRSLEVQITLVRRMDNATIFQAELKVRSKRQLDEKLLAINMAKEIGEKLNDQKKEIREALVEADRRYVPPPAEAVAAAPAPRVEPAPVAEVPQPETPKPPQPAPAEAAESAAVESPQQPGTVEVNSNLESAEVYVDEGFVGNAPALVKLSPGKHRVRVSLAGQEDWVRELTVLSGSELKLYAQLAAKAVPEKSPPPDPKALSKQDILDLLSNFVPNARIAALVGQHGIRFQPTPADLTEIEGAGGDSNLLATLRKAAAPAQ